MKKKWLAFLLSGLMALSLAGCGGGAPTIEDVPEVSPTETQSPKSEQTPSEPDEMTTPQETAAIESVEGSFSEIDGNVITLRDDGSGTPQGDSTMQKVPVLTSREIGYFSQSGPVTYSINSFQLSNLTAVDESTASFLGVEAGKAVAIVAIDFTVENTSEEDIGFYPDQSVIVTDTKEQVAASTFLSDNVGGDFFGNVEKNGQVFYICERSVADEIHHVQLRIDGPHNSDYETIGDNITVEFELVK